ncbi:MAG: guanylate kinase [Candidatus Omnitrophica bacterium CG1_02_46_14]|nr:MAG: guanylate kinase [Candidatus Omnitrophica bacterium CG1_02_46_14]
MLSKCAAFTKSAALCGGLNHKGKLFVISASSGTGKTTLARELLKEDKNLVASISYTTRLPRPNEHSGVDYFFITKNEFLDKKKKGGFLEWANVFGKFYGTPKTEVEEHLKHGRDVLLLIDVQGAKKIKRTRPDAIFIFLAPPSKKELKKRLEKRGTESKQEINRRYKVATTELKELNNLALCDYRIMNRYIPRALEVLEGIIRAERMEIKK